MKIQNHILIFVGVVVLFCSRGLFCSEAGRRMGTHLERAEKHEIRSRIERALQDPFGVGPMEDVLLVDKDNIEQIKLVVGEMRREADESHIGGLKAKLLALIEANLEKWSS